LTEVDYTVSEEVDEVGRYFSEIISDEYYNQLYRVIIIIVISLSWA